MENRKPIPHGAWFRMAVAPQTTEEQIVQAFCRAGIQLTPEQICIREFENNTRGAIVSFNHNTICAVLQSRVQGVSLNGKEINLRLMPPRESERGNPPPPPPNESVWKGA